MAPAPPISPDHVFVNCPFDDEYTETFRALQYRYQKFISDLAGMDIHAHGAEPETALIETRHWLTNVSRRQLLGERDLLTWYRAFREELPTLAERLGLDPAGLTYADFDQILGYRRDHLRALARASRSPIPRSASWGRSPNCCAPWSPPQTGNPA